MADQQIIFSLPVDLSSTWAQVVKGANWHTIIYIMDENEDAVDTTGWNMEMRVATTDNVLLSTLGIGTGITAWEVEGRYDIVYSETLTGALTVSHVKLEVKVEDAFGNIEYLFTATLPVYYPLG